MAICCMAKRLPKYVQKFLLALHDEQKLNSKMQKSTATVEQMSKQCQDTEANMNWAGKQSVAVSQ